MSFLRAARELQDFFGANQLDSKNYIVRIEAVSKEHESRLQNAVYHAIGKMGDWNFAAEASVFKEFKLYGVDFRVGRHPQPSPCVVKRTTTTTEEFLE